MTSGLAALGAPRGRPAFGAVRTWVLALGLVVPSALAADTRNGQWLPPQGAREGDYRGDDTYRDPRGSSHRPRRERERPGEGSARTPSPDAPVRTYGWERGGTAPEYGAGYGSGWGDRRTPAGDSGWPSRSWGSEPRPQAGTGTDRGTWGYSPWEIRGERPWARQDGGRGERRSDRPLEPPPVPPPPLPQPPHIPYGLDPYSGGYGYPGVVEAPRLRY